MLAVVDERDARPGPLRRRVALVAKVRARVSDREPVARLVEDLEVEHDWIRRVHHVVPRAEHDVDAGLGVDGIVLGHRRRGIAALGQRLAARRIWHVRGGARRDLLVLGTLGANGRGRRELGRGARRDGRGLRDRRGRRGARRVLAPTQEQPRDRDERDRQRRDQSPLVPRHVPGDRK